jgi:hypothetical protein
VLRPSSLYVSFLSCKFSPLYMNMFASIASYPSHTLEFLLVFSIMQCSPKKSSLIFFSLVLHYQKIALNKILPSPTHLTALWSWHSLAQSTYCIHSAQTTFVEIGDPISAENSTAVGQHSSQWQEAPMETQPSCKACGELIHVDGSVTKYLPFAIKLSLR